MRAIDADALKEDLTRFYDNEVTARKLIDEQPTIQPDNGLQKLADEIASFKRHVKSDNSDYITGYLCALSVVEGMIADIREVTE